MLPRSMLCVFWFFFLPIAAPFWLWWDPSSQTYLIPCFLEDTRVSPQETQESQGSNYSSTWQSMYWGHFFPSVQLQHFRRLIIRLTSSSPSHFLERNMPGVFQKAIIFPSLQLNERLGSIHWVFLEFATQCALAVFPGIHMHQELSWPFRLVDGRRN